MTDNTYPLGRRHAPDQRDENFPMRLVVPARAERTYRYWYAYSVHLNQTGDTCVANAWTHLLCDSPWTHSLYALNTAKAGWEIGFDKSKMYSYVSEQSNEDGFRGWLYDRAQAIDEFTDTPPQGGTSVRAGAKVLQQMGAITTYHWASNVGDIANAVLNVGPVVMGTNWYNSMFDPKWVNGKAYLDVIESSGLAGGHAWKIDGYNSSTGEFRMKNSWGLEWGDKGFAILAFDDLDMLLNMNGEACLPVEAA